jgi:ornithine carbamoyltransferase
MTEHYDGSLEKIRTASWVTTVATMWPARCWPPERYWAWTSASRHHANFGRPMPWPTRQPAAARGVLLTDDVELGVGGSTSSAPDLGVSMGESIQERATRVPLLPYRATEQVMQATGQPGSKFMHSLPSVHNASTDLGRRMRDQFQLDGAEVTDRLFESPASIVSDRAESRLDTIKAVMTRAFGA